MGVVAICEQLEYIGLVEEVTEIKIKLRHYEIYI